MRLLDKYIDIFESKVIDLIEKFIVPLAIIINNSVFIEKKENYDDDIRHSLAIVFYYILKIYIIVKLLIYLYGNLKEIYG